MLSNLIHNTYLKFEIASLSLTFTLIKFKKIASDDLKKKKLMTSPFSYCKYDKYNN